MSEGIPTFPTTFAIELMREAELYYGGDIYKLQRDDEEYTEAMTNHERLAEFQKFAVLSDCEHALVAYYKVELSDKQKALLEIVHLHTSTYVKGHVVETLINTLSAKSKNSVDVAELLLETLGGGKGKGNGDAINRLVVELTGNTK